MERFDITAREFKTGWDLDFDENPHGQYVLAVDALGRIAQLEMQIDNYDETVKLAPGIISGLELENWKLKARIAELESDVASVRSQLNAESLVAHEATKRIAELNMEVDNARSDSFAEGYKSGFSDGATFEAELKKRIAELEGELEAVYNCLHLVTGVDPTE
jgi:predicted  nucleic acid-binding Zn-ribbon protein